MYSADLKNIGFVKVLKKNNKISVKTSGLYGSTRLLLANIFRTGGTSVGIPELNEWGTMIVFEGDEVDINLV